MDQRTVYPIIFAALILALILCAVKAFRNRKPIGKQLGLIELSCTIPILGNLLIVASSTRAVAVVGYYLYFLGMDFFILSFVLFTDKYCQGIGNGDHKPTAMFIILIADSVQILFDTVFDHGFTVEVINVSGREYYRLVPYSGVYLHRLIDYIIFACICSILILASVKTPRLYREKYLVILFSTIAIAALQTYFVFSRKPIDRSMIGYGIFGVLVFYLALYYRPLRLLDRMLSNMISDMPEAIFAYDPTGNCIWANEPALKLTHLKLTELDHTKEALVGIFGDREFTQSAWTESRVVGVGELARYYTMENHPVNEDTKHLAASFLIIRDTTNEQRRIQQELYVSTHDSLTGLYTKQHLFSCAKRMLAKYKNVPYLAIFVDVKNFKIVNDIFTTAFGDLALQQLASWIKADMNSHCVYGRLAGDTFGVFMPKEDFNAEGVEERLGTFAVSDGKVEHHLLIHLGIYEITERDIDISVMLDRAHLALSSISDIYKTHIAYYDNKLRDKILWDQRISSGLREAIETKQIRPYLQPITDRRGRIVGAEALARWIHPELGFMSPASFIPVFEKNGMIAEVDRHMWRCACETLSSWSKEHKDLFISVNISPKDFYFFDVASEIESLVREYSIEPSRLRIEITETVMINDAEERMSILHKLRSKGFIVEMDDFGSGYSSLNLLKEMPVDVLKIDMKFLSRSSDPSKAETIVRNIIRLSEELKIVSLTEGVETQNHFDKLSAMGCRLFQGYFFAKPMPVDEFERFTFGEKN